MKNKKGFTLVELLAVIVILALIMGIAVVSIGSVLQTSRRRVMYENAQSILNGVKKQLLINTADPKTSGKTYYGFSESILDQGGRESPLGGTFTYRSIVTTGTTPDKNISKDGPAVIWYINSSTPATCAANVDSYMYYDASTGKYSVCLTAGAGNPYVDCNETDIANEVTTCIKGVS